MPRTLYWYILRDLLKVFALTSGALAGIMSFGGLLRPLTEQGLGVGQVVQMLTLTWPAMSTYSLPIAALFAATMVYGRFSADNELTACRAAGISYLNIALPALLLGIGVATASLVCLCFVVPEATLRVEKVIYSNLGQLVATQIQRNHRVTFPSGATPLTIFADEAVVLADDPTRPGEQAVQLIGPMIVTYDSRDAERSGANASGAPRVRTPLEFYMARRATAFIRQNQNDGEVTISAQLEGGSKFPRRVQGTQQPGLEISIGTTEYRSAPLPSPVRENTKFMDISRLYELLDKPDDSRRVGVLLREFVRNDQSAQYLKGLADALNSGEGFARFEMKGEAYQLNRGSGAVEIKGNRLIVGSLDREPNPPVRLRQETAASKDFGYNVTARMARGRAEPTLDNEHLSIEVELLDAVVQTGTELTPHSNRVRSFTIPMPSEVSQIATLRTATSYTTDRSVPDDQRSRLLYSTIKLKNSIISEIHARVSFSLSCLILVLVGCLLGMMFRSGNFLSAFAVSVVPALLSIMLIVTGQHTAENVPWSIGANFNNPLQIGIILIWSGNAAVLSLAIGLYLRLGRT